MRKIVFDLNNHYGKYINIRAYTHIRAYHACRPLSIQEYLDKGIVPYTKSTAIKDIIDRLGAKRYEEQIKENFNEMWVDSEVSQRKVWLALNKDTLLEDAGHYLIYGSEFLNTLTNQIGRRELLKDVGIPTIFYCDIPIEDISKDWLDDVERAINEHEDDISVYVSQVKAENIIGLEHPKQIENPYKLGHYYRPNYKNLKYK